MVEFAVGMVVLAIVLLAAFNAWDSWFLPENQGSGIVKSKKIRPASSRIHMRPMGYGFATSMTRTSASYQVEIEMQGQIYTVNVSQTKYDALSINEQVNVGYVIGRVTGGYCIRL